MSDLLVRAAQKTTTVAEEKVIAALAQNAHDAMSQYKATLNEKQATSWDALVKKRTRIVFKTLDNLFGFFPDFKGMAFIEPSKQQANAFLACGLSGNRSKPDFHYRFSSHEEAVSYIEKWATGCAQRDLDKITSKEHEKSLTARLREFVSIGDVFYSSWGYDQTNIDYYKVVGFRGKTTLELQRIGGTIVDTHYHDSATKVPDLDHTIGEVFTKQAKVNQWDWKNGKIDVSVSLNSYSSASLKEKRADGTYSPDTYSWGR